MSLLEQNVVSRHNYLFCVAQNMLTKKKKKVANDKILGGDPIVPLFLLICTVLYFPIQPHICPHQEQLMHRNHEFSILH